MQGDAADDLYMIMFEFQHAPSRLAHECERIIQDLVERFPLGKALFQYIRLFAEICIAHRGIFRLEGLDLISHLIQLTQAPSAVAVEHIIDQSHSYTSLSRAKKRASL